MTHPTDADEFFEVLGNELGSIVGDDAWSDTGVTLTCALEDDFDVVFLHFLANLPMDDRAAAAVEDRTQKIKGAGDVQVADIDVPVFMGLDRLDESGPFAGRFGRLAG